jgi:hypothetical protein
LPRARDALVPVNSHGSRVGSWKSPFGGLCTLWAGDVVVVVESSVVRVGASAADVEASVADVEASTVDVSKAEVNIVTEDSMAVSDSVTVVVSSEVRPEVVVAILVVVEPIAVEVAVSLVHDDVVVDRGWGAQA